jgi:hypothetical protein
VLVGGRRQRRRTTGAAAAMHAPSTRTTGAHGVMHRSWQPLTCTGVGLVRPRLLRARSRRGSSPVSSKDMASICVPQWSLKAIHRKVSTSQHMHIRKSRRPDACKL